MRLLAKKEQKKFYNGAQHQCINKACMCTSEVHLSDKQRYQFLHVCLC